MGKRREMVEEFEIGSGQGVWAYIYNGRQEATWLATWHALTP